MRLKQANNDQGIERGGAPAVICGTVNHIDHVGWYFPVG
jgi:hypothetical protein